jgi:hypothetical protein
MLRWSSKAAQRAMIALPKQCKTSPPSVLGFADRLLPLRLNRAICYFAKIKETTIYLRIKIFDMECAKSTKLSLLELKKLKAL